MLVGGAGGGAGAGAAAGAVWGAAAGAVCTRPLRVGMCQLKREPCGRVGRTFTRERPESMCESMIIKNRQVLVIFSAYNGPRPAPPCSAWPQPCLYAWCVFLQETCVLWSTGVQVVQKLFIMKREIGVEGGRFF